MKVQTIKSQLREESEDLIQNKLIDHILNFNPLNSATSLDSSTPQPSFLIPEAIPTISWPPGLTPTPQPLPSAPDPDSALPQADVLVVTWTVAEALALSDALTPGFRSVTDWYSYAHNWQTKFKPIIHGAAPSLKVNRLGKWFLTTIGEKSVICLKSELHMARDGAKMPVKELWKQLISEVNPSLLITTGTAGAIGSSIQLGDVIVTKKVRFDCKRTFAHEPFSQAVYTCRKRISVKQVRNTNATLMNFTASRLPKANRTAQIITRGKNGIKPNDVVTTDFFAFDDDTNDYQLQGLGTAVEMGDATLGLACEELENTGEHTPAWVAIRNASDPQISGGDTLKEKADKAGRIYEKYGYWTTINSAIACWAVITSLA
jgi:nucleoside phosphorylase